MTGASHANPEAATRRLSTLLDRPAAAALEALGPDRDVLLVGGAVRDCLLGREVRDFDRVTSSDRGVVRPSRSSKPGSWPGLVNNTRI